jgi:hypothetical protein
MVRLSVVSNHLRPLRSDRPAIFGLTKMIIGALLFLAFVIAIGVFIVKLIEWRHEALFGRYLKRRRGSCLTTRSPKRSN